MRVFMTRGLRPDANDCAVHRTRAVRRKMIMRPGGLERAGVGEGDGYCFYLHKSFDGPGALWSSAVAVTTTSRRA